MDGGSSPSGPGPSFLVLLLEFAADLSAASSRPNPLPEYCAEFYTRELVPRPCEAASPQKPRDIRVATVTPEDLVAMATERQQKDRQQGGEPSTEPKPAVSAATTIEKAFFSGNPSAGLTHGLLHLMKDTGGDWGSNRPSVLAMLSVPAHMTVADLAEFVAGYSSSDLQEMKVIRDSNPGQFMVLLQFSDQAATDAFYNDHHGAPFNSLEPEVTCCLAYVARIDTMAPGARFPVRDLVELPTCPVCLDRLDEPLRGVLTILCNHSFHIRCLDKWDESSCPVCRFVQTPQPSGGNRCARCGESDNLWICLICGYVGCGRYNGGHAHDHFSGTSHTFAMEVGTDRVWDYCGDNFVHRLVQNKADGKLVQVGGEADDKLDAVTLEYTYLLTSQLESQRIFYEEQLQRQADSLREATLQAERDRDCRSQVAASLEEARKERVALEKRLGQLGAKLQKLQKELDDERGFNASLSANQRDLQERLQEAQARQASVARKKDEEIEQLREEMRDLYAHLEGGQQLAGQLTQDEAAGSQLLVGAEQGGGAAAAAAGKDRGGKKRAARR